MILTSLILFGWLLPSIPYTILIYSALKKMGSFNLYELLIWSDRFVDVIDLEDEYAMQFIRYIPLFNIVYVTVFGATITMDALIRMTKPIMKFIMKFIKTSMSKITFNK